MAAGRPRIKDVAEYAGVSQKTVSNVINQYEHVSDKTRRAVQEAIDALGYRVNLAGRHLRQGRTGMIALVVPELDVAYFSELAAHVVAAAEQRSRTVLIHQTGGRRDRETSALHGFDADFVDGVIISPLALLPDDLRAADRGLPVVLLGERNTTEARDHVGIDNVAAAREATAHLLAGGHRRIAVVGGRLGPASGTDQLRTQGYRQALEAAGLPFDPELVLPVDAFHWLDGARAAAALADRGAVPDALLCLNDHLALGAVRALHERGFKAPDDVAVCGFDDIEAGRFSIPSLTTIAPDKAALARAALELLLMRISSDSAVPLKAVEERCVAHRLVIRESTAGC
ncbi:LacI family transcriptional regulator [Streptomyces purpurogeneiscleroticus]|nr:LacI family transcriptional regulator [Streptomyces purpurogeneiscleroticus]